MSSAVPAEPSPAQKITAYYSLVFPTFTFYIQTLSVTIGRRCSSSANAPSSSTDTSPVDVDLGALKSVSRLHAKIEYDSEDDRFVLAVIGRNGAWVDGVWSGSGSRAPLGERSQIQIADRIFHFVLPPPPPPEDATTPSTPSSTNRPRSPSVDITSISPPSSLPSHSPPPREGKPALPLPEPEPDPEPEREPQQPASAKSKVLAKNINSKKRKKGGKVETPPVLPPKEKPKPEEMPPKPTFTYSQLIQKAIKAHDGKATLHEICVWIQNEFDYYRWTESSAWTSSIRHNLSSGRAFKKMERCGGDRGKGCFWSVDEDHVQALEEQEAKQAAGGKKKERGAPLSEPALKRSIKGDTKGTPLPPPLTSAPLQSMIGSTPTIHALAPQNGVTAYQPIASGVFSYNAASATGTTGYSGIHTAPNPYAALTQPLWGYNHRSVTIPTAPSVPQPVEVGIPAKPASVPATIASQDLLSHMPNVILPIELDTVSRPHAQCPPDHANNSTCARYMSLVDQKVLLDPEIFAAGTTQAMLDELSKMPAKKAMEILQGHLSRILTVRRKKRKEARAKGKARPVARKSPTGPTGSTPNDAESLAVDAPMNIGSSTVPVVAIALEGGSPILVVDDSDDEAPAAKRRRTDESIVSSNTNGS